MRVLIAMALEFGQAIREEWRVVETSGNGVLGGPTDESEIRIGDQDTEVFTTNREKDN